MKKILIFKPDEDAHSASSDQHIREADLVLVQAMDDPAYFYILKSRYSQTNKYIHGSRIVDLSMGNSVRLYNRAELHEGDDEWKADERELYAQMDEILNNIKKNERPMNALSRMEIDD